MSKHFLWVSIIVAAIAVVIFIVTPQSVYHCIPYTLLPPPKLEGVLKVNDKLTKVDYILKGQIHGPESIVVDGDTIITGTQDGMVTLIKNGTINKVSRFGWAEAKLCDGGFDAEPMCGRPLGIRRLDKEHVVAIDTYFGIYLINFDKGIHTVILGNETVVDGKPIHFLNDIEVLNNDVLLFTDSSSKWDRRHHMNVLLEGVPNGRVLRFTRSTGKIDVLLDNLFFPNGIQLFSDKNSFLVAETGAARIRRHWIAGPRMGKTEIFAENLPGLPDNIRLGSDETFWVAMATVRHSSLFSVYDFLADKPHLRKFILQLIPERHWSRLLSMLSVRHAMILKLNKNGNIIASAHDPDGQMIKDISEVTEAGQYLYLGSYHAPYIARLPINAIA